MLSHRSLASYLQVISCGACVSAAFKLLTLNIENLNPTWGQPPRLLENMTWFSVSCHWKASKFVFSKFQFFPMKQFHVTPPVTHRSLGKTDLLVSSMNTSLLPFGKAVKVFQNPQRKHSVVIPHVFLMDTTETSWKQCTVMLQLCHSFSVVCIHY